MSDVCVTVPASWEAVDPGHKEMIKYTSGLLHEPRLFTAGVELPLEHPVVHAAPIDEAAEDFMLVMEDLTVRGADPRDATRPLTTDLHTAQALAELAGRA